MKTADARTASRQELSRADRAVWRVPKDEIPHVAFTVVAGEAR
ncbi:hypothetical protein [Rhodococcus tibetensis]|uniref:Uncharacterized protein n=1 Tax=Rhodococcus tibetensis TaxID=2965064 RepID=A0ABT1QDW1_9NOCA|nr:hypothetical protein [Rhodococcus sp. FXJ9.536]MCQ4120451.1 hypothetical protein [Rhodococcus sp. FXJ9.536]